MELNGVEIPLSCIVDEDVGFPEIVENFCFIRQKNSFAENCPEVNSEYLVDGERPFEPASRLVNAIAPKGSLVYLYSLLCIVCNYFGFLCHSCLQKWVLSADDCAPCSKWLISILERIKLRTGALPSLGPRLRWLHVQSRCYRVPLLWGLQF